MTTGAWRWSKVAATLAAAAIAGCGGGSGGDGGGGGERFAIRSERVNYTAGPDGVFGTADDASAGFSWVNYQASGDSELECWFNPSGRGEDDTMFTADDVPAGCFDQVGMTEGFSIGGPGEDGVWGTADDLVTALEEFDAVADGTTRINAYFGDAGPDDTWGTEDDVETRAYRRELNPNDAERRRVSYVGPGEDGVWHTDDDELGAEWYGVWFENFYDEGNEGTKWGAWDRQIRYSGAGADGIWLTADDVASNCLTHEFADGTQYWTEEFTFTPGPDGVCFTADDVQTVHAVGVNTY